MANDLMEPHFFYGPGTNLWRGTSLFQTPTPTPTSMTLHAVQEPHQTRRLPTSLTSIVILPALTSSFQLPLKLLGHGTRWLLNWFKRLAGGSHVTEDSRETVFLFQRLSIALQRGNAVSFLSTFAATE